MRVSSLSDLWLLSVPRRILLSDLENAISASKVPRRCKTSWALLHLKSNEISVNHELRAELEMQLGTSDHHYTWSNTKSQRARSVMQELTLRWTGLSILHLYHSHATPLNRPP